MDLKTLSIEALVALRDEKKAEFDALVALDAPTTEDIDNAEALADEIDEIIAEQAERDTAAAAQAERHASLKDRFSTQPEEETTEGEQDPEEDEEEPEVEPEPEPEVEAAAEEPAPKKAAARTKKVAVLARKTPRPPTPERDSGIITITAAADSGFAAGQKIGMDELGQAAIHRLRGMAVPNGTGEGEDLRMFPIGNMALDFPEDMRITNATSEETAFSILKRAGDETRLPGESLTAAAGWCAPSETIYDLCSNEVVDGIFDLPEVQVSRGGIKHPTTSDFSAVYAAVGNIQTEAQAIAGTAKTCYEVPCPSFVDDRLDAVYSCIKVPLLLQAGYPEQVRDIMNKTVIAQQYKVNASVISRVVTYAGAARDFTGDLGSTTVALLSGLDLVLEDLRQKWRLGQNATLEVVLPVWARSAIRNDLGARNGRPPEAVSDAEIMAHFAVRHARVQFVYGWQELPAAPVVWPASVEFLAYPAGSLVKGRSDVINLSAVYDAASLATNLYTGLFQEEGLLVAKMCQEVVRGTIPTNQAGRTGAPNLT